MHRNKRIYLEINHAPKQINSIMQKWKEKKRKAKKSEERNHFDKKSRGRKKNDGIYSIFAMRVMHSIERIPPRDASMILVIICIELWCTSRLSWSTRKFRLFCLQLIWGFIKKHNWQLSCFRMNLQISVILGSSLTGWNKRKHFSVLKSRNAPSGRYLTSFGFSVR